LGGDVSTPVFGKDTRLLRFGNVGNELQIRDLLAKTNYQRGSTPSCSADVVTVTSKPKPNSTLWFTDDPNSRFKLNTKPMCPIRGICRIY
jgi:hypothetical protein